MKLATTHACRAAAVFGQDLRARVRELGEYEALVELYDQLSERYAAGRLDPPAYMLKRCVRSAIWAFRRVEMGEHTLARDERALCASLSLLAIESARRTRSADDA